VVVNSRFQYPHNSSAEIRLLSRFNDSPLLELIFALRKWRAFYMSSAKRALRSLSDQYSHLEFRGHLELSPDFVFEQERAIPRGTAVAGQYFSAGYDLAFSDLPPEIVRLTYSFKSVVECLFASPVNVRPPYVWRNHHVPVEFYAREQEVFADGFHQDLVVDQFNAQLFILLHDTTPEHGPLEYLDPQIQASEMSHYRKRNQKVPVSTSKSLTGKRGDYLLLSTGSTLHRASNPAEGCSRDILSLAFFPSYTSLGTPIESLPAAARQTTP
jgi:hypothetical protein